MVDETILKSWFHESVFPLDAELTRFLKRNWRDQSEIADLRQEIYVRVYRAARETLPDNAAAYLFTVARNHLINQARRSKVVSFEHIHDMTSSSSLADHITPDRIATARDDLEHLQKGLELLPPRCRQIVVLRKVEGLKVADIASRLGVTVSTVDNQLALGMRALIDFALGGSGLVKRAKRGGTKIEHRRTASERS